MRQTSFSENKHYWLEELLFRWRSRPIIKQIISHKKENILDLGCGYHAYLLRQLLKKFLEIKMAIGMDVSVDQCLNKVQNNLQLITADLNKPIELTNQTFDLVMCTAVLEHLTNYHQLAAEIFRLLRPGGYLLLTTPSPWLKPILNFLAFRLKVIDRQEIIDHKHYFTKDELRSLFNKNGFSEVRVLQFQFGLNYYVICRK